MLPNVPDLKERLQLERDLLDALPGILEAADVEEATLVVRDLVAKFGGTLLSLKFSDITGEKATIRPYSGYPDIVRQTSITMQPTGGCPFYKESQKRLSPFSLSLVDRSLYRELNDRIFFRELDQLGFGDILVLPVVIGSGIAVTTIGLPEADHNSPAQQAIKGAFPHVVAAFISKFPSITTLFEDRCLTKTERKVMQALASGISLSDVCGVVGLSSTTVMKLLQSASRKLGANSLVELGIKAAASGELYDADGV